MNKISKTLIVAIAIVIMTPSAFAATNVGTSAQVNVMRDKMQLGAEGSVMLPGGPRGVIATNFCTILPTIDTKIDAAINAWTKGGGTSTGRVAAPSAVNAYWGGTVKGGRINWDQARINGYAKMMAAATTDAQRAAVADFKVAVEAAIKDKRVAMDAWVDGHVEGMDDWQKQAKLGGGKVSLSDLSIVVQSSTKRAMASCDDGTDPAVVAAAFKSDIEAARANFKAALDAEAKAQWTAENRAQLQKIMSDFNAKVKAATDKLKASYDVKASVKA